MTTPNTLFKFLRPDGTTPHGHATWPLPKGRRPGKWMPKLTGELVLCANAYHLMDVSQLLQWATSDAVLYEVEWRGAHISDAEKHGVEQARVLRQVTTWNDRNLRLFAADCAERVLPIFERERPDDDRPRQTIVTARRFAVGQATGDELAAARYAAGDAAWYAAWYAAWAAAWAAARYAAGYAAWYAAWDAAGDAERYAARYAAWYAAWYAERKWQTERLAQYLSAALAERQTGNGDGGERATADGIVNTP